MENASGIFYFLTSQRKRKILDHTWDSWVTRVKGSLTRLFIPSFTYLAKDRWWWPLPLGGNLLFSLSLSLFFDWSPFLFQAFKLSQETERCGLKGIPQVSGQESSCYLHNSTLGLEAQSKSTSDYIYFFFAISPSVSRLAHSLLIGRNVFKVVVFLFPISIINLWLPLIILIHLMDENEYNTDWALSIPKSKMLWNQKLSQQCCKRSSSKFLTLGDSTRKAVCKIIQKCTLLRRRKHNLYLGLFLVPRFPSPSLYPFLSPFPPLFA